MKYEEYIRNSTLPKEVVDLYLSQEEATFAQFHPELGYTLGNYMPRDGADGCLTILTTQANGSRTSSIYADVPCRINTYGDSFTHCHQVSDHETWQEHLAAHLGEPMRNFGVGSYGVYQAYKRMLLTEQTEDAAEYVMLYIWGDDHYRSCVRCRHTQIHQWFNHQNGQMFHGNFWSNLEMDLESGILTEKANLLSTPESLYKMTDSDFMWEALHDDLMLQMSAFVSGGCSDLDSHALNRLAGTLGLPPVGGDCQDAMIESVSQLRDAYALSATKYIIDRSLEFTEQNGKKLLICLFDPKVTRQLVTDGKRYDAPVVEHLQSKGARYFDMNLVHVEDFKAFNLSLEDYMKRYMLSHYNPLGNQFFAMSIKDTFVDWLNPKPITYRDSGQAHISFDEDYLPDWQ